MADGEKEADDRSIVIDAGDKDFRIEFNGTIADFKLFIKEELDQINQCVEKHNRPISNTGGALASVILSEEINRFNEWHNKLSASNKVDEIDIAHSIQTTIIEFLNNKKIIFPSSKIGRRIAAIPSSNAFYYACLIAKNSDRPTINVRNLTSNDEVKVSDFVIAAFAGSHIPLDVIGIPSEEINRIYEAFHTKVTELKNLIKETESVYKRVESLEEYLMEKMKTEASVKYWNEVESHQEKRVKRATWGMIVGSGALLIATWVWIQLALPGIASLFNDITDSTIPGFSLLALNALPIILGLWVLRFPARVFVQSLALRADAKSRATMVQTYLALGQDSKVKPTDVERALILQALFRPSIGESPDVNPHIDLQSLLKYLAPRSS